MILTLHDELQFEVRKEVTDEFTSELPGLMCNPDLDRFGLKIPLKIEIKVGPTWGQTEPWKGSQSV